MKYYTFFLLVLIATSCGNSDADTAYRLDPKGGRVYGGTLKINEVYTYISLYPSKITDVVSHSLANQIYEGLVRFDRRNITKILPSIAESWEVDPAGLIYTFHLKKGVLFHDDPCFPNGKGREVKAQDVKYSFELLCTQSESNLMFESTFKGKIKGADQHYNSGSTESMDAIKILDDHTLQVTLNDPINTFLYILASAGASVIPYEAIEKYGDKSTVGTGPFVFNKKSNGSQVLLLRNSSYHRADSLGNQLPFLDSVIVNFISDKKKELAAFKSGDIHVIIGLPTESISEMVEAQIADFDSKNPKYHLHRTPEMSTQYYQFNIHKKPFDKLKVRQAFSYAIDRNKIIKDVLNTAAFGPGICGLTPPGISGYDITDIKGYTFSADKAKKLLAEAGYPGGRNFPPVTVEINSGGGKHIGVIEEVKKQLKKVLNINIDFVVVPFSQKLEDAKYGRIDMCRAGWVADYPTPENFLRIFSGETVPDSLHEPSYPNTTRYKNQAYDSLFRLGVTAKSIEDGYVEFLKAEQLMMKDAPVLVLWYDEGLKMTHSFVKNFFFNSMNYKDFSEVYIKKETPENP